MWPTPAFSSSPLFTLLLALALALLLQHPAGPSTSLFAHAAPTRRSRGAQLLSVSRDEEEPTASREEEDATPSPLVCPTQCRAWPKGASEDTACPSGCVVRWCADSTAAKPRFRCEAPQCSLGTYTAGSVLVTACRCDEDNDPKTPPVVYKHEMFYAGRGDITDIQQCVWGPASRNCLRSRNGWVGKERLTVVLNRTAQTCCNGEGNWYAEAVDHCW